MQSVLIVEFLLPGVPVPQGSKTGRVLQSARGPVASLYNDNDKTLKPWRKAVTAAAAAAHAGGARIEGAVIVEVEFRTVRPKSVKREFPTVKPDVDKLQRALFDGITDAGVWRDDSQVVTVLARKRYADQPGVHVRVGEYSTDDTH